MSRQLPGSDISRVLGARKLGDAEVSLFVADRSLRTRSSERTPKGDDLRKPLRIVGMFLVIQVTFKV